MLWTLSVRSLFRDLLLEGVWHAFFKIWVPIGAPIGAPCGYFWQLFQGLILEPVLGWQKGAKSTNSEKYGGGGGACRLCLWQNLKEVLHAERRAEGTGRRI